MDRLWAPWRAQYVSRPSPSHASSGCFLCQGLASPLSEDRSNLLVWRRARTVVVLNRFPYNNAHLLVAPIQHRGTLGDFSGDELLEPIETIQKVIAILDRMMEPQGYNVGLNQGKAAGAGLPGHLHWHVVPRWDGDTNFMPVIGKAKVIVECLYEFHDRFVQELSVGDGPAA